MKKILRLVTLTTALLSCQEIPLQRADNDFDVTVETPAFKENNPIILFDEGHNNFHKTNGLYRPFANLVRNDGYEIKTLLSFVLQRKQIEKILLRVITLL